MSEVEYNSEDIYAHTLTHNVISRYDSTIKRLLKTWPHVVVYSYSPDGWEKTGFQGPLALYGRNSHWDEYDLSVPSADNEKELIVPDNLKIDPKKLLEDNNWYKYALLVLNRSTPDLWTVGILGDKYLKSEGILVEDDDVVVVRDINGDVWGLWCFEGKDYLIGLLQWCLEN